MKPRRWHRRTRRRKEARQWLAEELRTLDVVEELRSAVLRRNDFMSENVLERFEKYLIEPESVSYAELSELMMNVLGLLVASEVSIVHQSRLLVVADFTNAVGLAGIDLWPAELAMLRWRQQHILGSCGRDS